MFKMNQGQERKEEVNQAVRGRLASCLPYKKSKLHGFILGHTRQLEITRQDFKQIVGYLLSLSDAFHFKQSLPHFLGNLGTCRELRWSPNPLLSPALTSSAPSPLSLIWLVSSFSF